MNLKKKANTWSHSELVNRSSQLLSDQAKPRAGSKWHTSGPQLKVKTVKAMTSSYPEHRLRKCKCLNLVRSTWSRTAWDLVPTSAKAAILSYWWEWQNLDGRQQPSPDVLLPTQTITFVWARRTNSTQRRLVTCSKHLVKWGGNEWKRRPKV